MIIRLLRGLFSTRPAKTERLQEADVFTLLAALPQSRLAGNAQASRG